MAIPSLGGGEEQGLTHENRLHQKLPHKSAHHLGQRGICTQPGALLNRERGGFQSCPIHSPPEDSLPRLSLTRTPTPLLTRVPETGGPPGWEGRACGGVGRAITTRVGAVGKPGTCCPMGGRGERPKRAEGWALALQPAAPTTVDRAPPPKLPLPGHYLRPRRQLLPPWPDE